MEFIKLLLVSTLLTLLSGQIIRIPPSQLQGAISLTDIFVFLLDFSYLFFALFYKRSLKLPLKIFPSFLIFTSWALATSVWSLTIFTPSEVTTSAFFLVRYISYFFLAIIVFNVVAQDKIKNWVNLILIIGGVYILTGLLQFLFIPDLTFLTPFGWDPHQRRIVGAVIDPNFSGFIFTLIFSLSISHFLFLPKRPKISPVKYSLLFLALISFVSIILTYSRSSYLALLASVATLGSLKSRKLLSAILLLLIVVFLITPSVRLRIIGAITFDETAKARIESWQNALVIIRDNPLFGVGFNSYRFAQAKYNFFSQETPLGGHSGGGVDSSLLLITATTGIIGFSIFIFFLYAQIKSLFKHTRKSPLHLATLASIFGLLVHSVFVNSLFFPQIMLLVFFLLGLAMKYDS